ncbi:MAG: hypothetical protein MRY64_14570 [Hyphomonadaceae bacterium]|nr:hypothetical protein [Hyphomonadaceae bacterium]
MADETLDQTDMTPAQSSTIESSQNAAPASAPPTQDDLNYYATRPSAELDEIRIQADYLARSMISFWRFRELGGGRRPPGKDTALGLNEHSGSGVHYVSDHPEVRILSLSFIFLLVIFESAANAYFFAQDSEFGLFGGVFQAAAVSLANVSTSYFIIGYWGLRHISVPLSSSSENSDARGVASLLVALVGAVFAMFAVMTFGLEWRFGLGILIAALGLVGLATFKIQDGRIYIKLFGFFAICFGVATVLMVNLSAAHYRNILDLQALGMDFPETLKTTTFPRFFIEPEVCDAVLKSEIGNTIGSAATNAMCRPFALHSLDAMVLFALGLAISALAAFEGRKADSAFPGLSDAARHFEGARRDLQYALEDYYDSYEDVFEEIESDFKQTLGGSAKVQLRKAMDEAVSEYAAMLETADKLLADEFDVTDEIVALVRRPAKRISGGSA